MAYYFTRKRMYGRTFFSHSAHLLPDIPDLIVGNGEAEQSACLNQFI